MNAAVARLLAGFAALPVTQRVREQLRLKSQRKVGGLWGGSAALLVAVLRGDWPGPLLVLTADDVDSLQLQAELQTFGVAAAVLPRLELDADGLAVGSAEGDRARALLQHRDGVPLLAGIEALLQPCPTPPSLRHGRLLLRRGQQLLRDALLEQARGAGLRQVPLVLAAGEFSPRGDVVDLYPLAAPAAVRLEFLDATLESIRSFDPGSQRTIEVLDAVELLLGGGELQLGPVARHLQPQRLLLLGYEPLRTDERAALLTALDAERGRLLAALHDTLRPCPRLDLTSLPSHDLDFKVLSAGSAAGAGEADPLGRLRAVRGLHGRVLLCCRSDDERQRLAEIFAHKQVDLAAEQVELLTGVVARGFRLPELATTVLSNVEFAGVPQQAALRLRPVLPSRAIQSFFELGPGDLVVHAVHGIARFLGTELVSRGEGAEDHLKLQFQGDVLLLVPASKIHLVQKYVGTGGKAPLDKLGGKSFARRKAEVEEALFDLAADLLEVQAARQRVQRPPYPRMELEPDFLDAFPFHDTADQATTWTELQRDLEAATPMDRLLCGDVGFGKTELALRAAFRVASNGRQVAVLVPTTVLAEQHARNFARRCEPFSLRVELLSRYRAAGERKAVLAGLAKGLVDIVVGTHQLLGDQVQFKDLGLCIIDEEQRFGVQQKERMKQLRTEVDVLTLSATPIPRTLHSALLGIRSISTLNAPPPGRQEVETRVLFRDDRVLQTAVQQELLRKGQVFVLHNRIPELPLLAARIQQLVPPARIAVGHGQLTGAEVERTVRAFVRGDVDVLVSTTIVENGLDLPRANTILIDRADLFGLAELHQLRGRVGRSEQKAYCYLLLDRDAPPSEEGKKRLKALEEFSHLGAGFAIAMKDLEIRGAGNLLGPEQSGHIASVGYDMYCQLLQQAVQNAKAGATGLRPASVVEVDVDLRLQAYLPADFVAEPKQRLELLREMDAAVDDERLQALEGDLADRFGKLPVPVRNLLRVFRLKWALQAVAVRGVSWVEQDRLVVRHAAGQPLGGAWLDAFADVRAVEADKTHLMLPPLRGGRQRAGTDVLAFLLDALSGRAAAAMMPRRWQQDRGRSGRGRRSGSP